MKSLRRFLDRIRPKFEKDGKFERLYPLYEAVDTFLFTPGKVTQRASHVRDSIDLKRMMITVVVALLPCVLMALWNTGHQANLAYQLALKQGLFRPGSPPVSGWREPIIAALGGSGHDPGNAWDCVVYGAAFFLPLYFVSVAVGGTWEVIFSCIRGHDVTEGFLVTSLLFPLTLPPTLPLWQAALGVSFGVVLGKEVFGGVGKNFLNPALTCRAFVYFAYPQQMTGGKIWTAVTGLDVTKIDGYSAATPLTHLGGVTGAQAKLGMDLVTGALQNGGLDITWADTFFGTIPGSLGETSTLACLIGAAVLIGTGIGSWRIMTGLLSSAVISALAFYLAFQNGATSNAMFAMPPWWHVTVGGFAFGTVFMATDPVSAAMTHTGQWIYGGLIGVMTILIRVVNPAFAEGIMLSILLGNVFAPLIDWCVLQVNIRRRKRRTAVETP